MPPYQIEEVKYATHDVLSPMEPRPERGPPASCFVRQGDPVLVHPHPQHTRKAESKGMDRGA